MVIKYCVRILLLNAFIFVAGDQLNTSNIDDLSQTVTTIYTRSDESFPNPERGFYEKLGPWGTNPRPPLKVSDLQNLRNRNITLARRIYLISEFIDKPLSNSFLEKVSMDLSTSRKAGVKLILRFSYNWLGGGDDAPKDRILSHIRQLKPVLEKNYDVIAYMEAGFIGFWGEWNRSSNGLRKNPVARRAILHAILDALPQDRMVALRYSYYKGDIFHDFSPLTQKEGFNKTKRARTGAHNDCFLAGIDDWGTYNHTDPDIVEEQKIFLSLDNRYVVQGGEVCNPSKYDDCPNALAELKRMHWSSLNATPSDGKEILEDWEVQGCMKEIVNRLGYRLRLEKSKISKLVRPGGKFKLDLELINEGWASPYNPRLVEVILRNIRGHKEYYLPVNEKPGQWMPNEINNIHIAGYIPKNIESGKYEVLINLPDPNLNLYNRPEYSIRLANKNMWEASTGYNSILSSISIVPPKVNQISSKRTVFKLRIPRKNTL